MAAADPGTGATALANVWAFMGRYRRISARGWLARGWIHSRQAFDRLEVSIARYERRSEHERCGGNPEVIFIQWKTDALLHSLQTRIAVSRRGRNRLTPHRRKQFRGFVSSSCRLRPTANLSTPKCISLRAMTQVMIRSAALRDASQDTIEASSRMRALIALVSRR
jgi:hypothetical protein